MKKKYKLLLIALGVLFLFLFQLQIIVPVVYILIGFTLYMFFFCWAKAKELDADYVGWDIVLNTTRGMCYFIISGSFLWLFVLVPLLVEQRGKIKYRKSSNKNVHAWVEYLKNPMKLHEDWFNNFYQ